MSGNLSNMLVGIIAIVGFVLVVSCWSAALGAEPVSDTIEGVWLPSSAELGGKTFPDEVRKSIRLEIKGDQYLVTVGKNPSPYLPARLAAAAECPPT